MDPPAYDEVATPPPGAGPDDDSDSSFELVDSLMFNEAADSLLLDEVPISVPVPEPVSSVSSHSEIIALSECDSEGGSECEGKGTDDDAAAAATEAATKGPKDDAGAGAEVKVQVQAGGGRHVAAADDDHVAALLARADDEVTESKSWRHHNTQASTRACGLAQWPEEGGEKERDAVGKEQEQGHEALLAAQPPAQSPAGVVGGEMFLEGFLRGLWGGDAATAAAAAADNAAAATSDVTADVESNTDGDAGNTAGNVDEDVDGAAATASPSDTGEGTGEKSDTGEYEGEYKCDTKREAEVDTGEKGTGADGDDMEGIMERNAEGKDATLSDADSDAGGDAGGDAGSDAGGDAEWESLIAGAFEPHSNKDGNATDTNATDTNALDKDSSTLDNDFKTDASAGPVRVDSGERASGEGTERAEGAGGTAGIKAVLGQGNAGAGNDHMAANAAASTAAAAAAPVRPLCFQLRRRVGRAKCADTLGVLSCPCTRAGLATCRDASSFQTTCRTFLATHKWITRAALLCLVLSIMHATSCGVRRNHRGQNDGTPSGAGQRVVHGEGWADGNGGWRGGWGRRSELYRRHGECLETVKTTGATVAAQAWELQQCRNALEQSREQEQSARVGHAAFLAAHQPCGSYLHVWMAPETCTCVKGGTTKTKVHVGSKSEGWACLDGGSTVASSTEAKERAAEKETMAQRLEAVEKERDSAMAAVHSLETERDDVVSTVHALEKERDAAVVAAERALLQHSEAAGIANRAAQRVAQLEREMDATATATAAKTAAKTATGATTAAPGQQAGEQTKEHAGQQAGQQAAGGTGGETVGEAETEDPQKASCGRCEAQVRQLRRLLSKAGGGGGKTGESWAGSWVPTGMAGGIDMDDVADYFRQLGGTLGAQSEPYREGLKASAQKLREDVRASKEAVTDTLLASKKAVKEAVIKAAAQAAAASEPLKTAAGEAWEEVVSLFSFAPEGAGAAAGAGGTKKRGATAEKEEEESGTASTKEAKKASRRAAKSHRDDDDDDDYPRQPWKRGRRIPVVYDNDHMWYHNPDTGSKFMLSDDGQRGELKVRRRISQLHVQVCVCVCVC
jgi:hypothetical protein